MSDGARWLGTDGGLFHQPIVDRIPQVGEVIDDPCANAAMPHWVGGDDFPVHLFHPFVLSDVADCGERAEPVKTVDRDPFGVR